MDATTRRMRKAERGRDPLARVFWGVTIPKGLKDEFVGLCKMRGHNVGDQVEELVARHIREEREAFAAGR